MPEPVPRLSVPTRQALDPDKSGSPLLVCISKVVVEKKAVTGHRTPKRHMKTCQRCGRSYADLSLKYCREDGALLTTSSPVFTDTSATLHLPAKHLVDRKTRVLIDDTSQRDTINSLAVLPLANACADADAEYLSDGITESLINIVAQVPNLRVVPRSTVFRYKGRDLDPQAIGRELNVRAVLDGRVSQIGDTLIVQADLIDVVNESQLWGEQYKRRMSRSSTVSDQTRDSTTCSGESILRRERL